MSQETTHTPNKRAPIGLFYGSSTCYTEMAAEKIQHILGTDKVDIFNIAQEPIATAQSYCYLIFGIPTWDYGELQEDWEEIWEEIDTIEFQGKKVALYGLGDQVGYPEWFLDALGYLHSKVQALGATMVGYWPATGYEYQASEALTENQQQFVGLALDDENEFELSEQRIQIWCQQISQEFGLSTDS